MNPVIYLAVAGDVEGVVAVREAVFSDPLSRPLTWPFVPHVTLADDAPPERIEAAVVALATFRLAVRFDRVSLLEEGPGRVWTPIADAVLGAPPLSGRGGLPVELHVSTAVPPDAAALAGAPLTITARRDGRVVGLLVAFGDEIVRLELAEGHDDVEPHLRRAFSRQ